MPTAIPVRSQCPGFGSAVPLEAEVAMRWTRSCSRRLRAHCTRRAPRPRRSSRRSRPRPSTRGARCPGLRTSWGTRQNGGEEMIGTAGFLIRVLAICRPGRIAFQRLIEPSPAGARPERDPRTRLDLEAPDVFECDTLVEARSERCPCTPRTLAGLVVRERRTCPRGMRPPRTRIPRSNSTACRSRSSTRRNVPGSGLPRSKPLGRR